MLHVGLPKTGTTYLQALLAANRDRLRAAGVLYPFVHPGAMFHGAVEIRGSHAKFGLKASDVAGTWETLCERAHEHEGTTILSHEVLAGATRQQIRTALEPLSGIEVHVVVTARDLGRQAVAHWQEEVKLGATYSFAEFEETELRADTGPGTSKDDGGSRPHFWHAQDFSDCLRRWSGNMAAGRGHLVVLPRPGVSPEELWTRFASTAGVDPAVLEAVPSQPANQSLGVAEIALLREVNALLEDRMDTRTYNQLVKRDYAEGVLAKRPGPRPRTPHDLGEVLDEATATWVAQIEEAECVVHGDLDDLTPVLAEPDDPRPDDVELGEDPAAVVAKLLPEERPKKGWFSKYRR